MLKYLRFLMGHILVLVGIVGMVLGGAFLWLGFLVTVVITVGGDALLGDDMREPDYRRPGFFMVSMYLALPLLFLLAISFAWMLGSGDFLGLGAFVSGAFGYDMFAARASLQPIHIVGGVLSAALLFALSGTDIGHELVHRTSDRPSLMIGRWLLAFTWDSQFSIEHVYGHHELVCTPRDPATARRGEGFYPFLLRSILGQVRSAWNLEANRLRKRGHSVFSVRNRMFSGWLMTLLITGIFFAAGGWSAAVLFTVSAIFGKSVLEVVNYFEHYGLVREPGVPVQPRHSWNTNKNMSNIVLHNVTRHSHHHAKGDDPFWVLKSMPEAPTMPYGYLTTLLIVYLTPWWFKSYMKPLLKQWDETMASPGERELVRTRTMAGEEIRANGFGLSNHESDAVLPNAENGGPTVNAGMKNKRAASSQGDRERELERLLRPISRSRFLKGAALGIATISTVSVATGCGGAVESSVNIPAGLEYLAEDHCRLLIRAAEVILPVKGTEFAALEDVALLENLDALVGTLSPPVREELLGALGIFNYGPYFSLYFQSFRNLSAERAANFCRSWESGFEIQRALMAVLKKLIFIAYWGAAATWPAIGYDGPVTKTFGIPKLGNAASPQRA